MNPNDLSGTDNKTSGAPAGAITVPAAIAAKPNADPLRFDQDLAVTLVLTVGATSVTVPGGHMKNFKAELHSYGFQASVHFWLLTEYDTLYSEFVKPDLMSVKFVIKAYYEQPEVPPAITLQGLVAKKTLAQTILYDVQAQPVLVNHYSVDFVDPARLLWMQHFPCHLMVNSTMNSMLEAHKGEKITLSYDFAPLDVQHPIIMVGLGDQANRASFYDFVMWYVCHHNGVWSYDSVNNSYKISTAKQDVGTQQLLARRHLLGFDVYFPGPPRADVQMLNHFTENVQKKTITNAQSVAGIRCDLLLCHPIPSEWSARETLETGRLQVAEAGIRCYFADFPQCNFHPGCLLGFESELGTQFFAANKVYRVFRVTVDGHAHDDQAILSKMETPVNGYDMSLIVESELQADATNLYPPFKVPHYPVHVQGKVVSEIGATTDETYQIYQDSNTSTDVYKIEIPLWDNIQVIAPYMPYQFSHHFYFPLFKKSRVLVAFDLHSAKIAEVLDWRANARLPMDGQGNHVLFGWSDQSQTSLRHTYANQLPTFSVKRKQAKDTELVEMKEGSIVLETKEE